VAIVSPAGSSVFWTEGAESVAGAVAETAVAGGVDAAAKAAARAAAAFCAAIAEGWNGR